MTTSSRVDAGLQISPDAVLVPTFVTGIRRGVAMSVSRRTIAREVIT
jgi:hypothetical protein